VSVNEVFLVDYLAISLIILDDSLIKTLSSLAVETDSVLMMGILPFKNVLIIQSK
jgi:hypothetical protein